ncbi:MAG: hypothetical protein CVV49_07925 [Spirochaetae bacterium HGW-Spirochaetae-5]|nr:MAG: hypothetical protein CVV49_07925 [Spirochaetae bacterium HGW-Spirochaetae-5]
MKKKIICFAFIIALVSAIYAQAEGDYAALYNSKEYDKSYNIILLKLNEIYRKRVEDRKIPAGYIALSNVGEDSDLITLFRQRKEKGFFIEDNPELSELHFYAGRCAAKLDKKKDSLNHYVQALRFRKLEQTRDDVIYYEISGIFKTYNEPVYFKGYIDALEQAYSLNPSNYLYSYEIGDALSVTKEKKKSIFHLKRYIENTDDEVKPEVYLKLGGLYESIGKYLDTEKYYNEYLRRKPEDGEILFALGYISYSKTGNYILAESSLQRVLKILKESDIYRRSKSYEYLGDMAYNNLKYDKALIFYNECINFQSKILELISGKNNERKNLTLEINKLKEALINNKEFEKYEDYEILIDDRNKIDKELEILQLEFNKLHPGRIRWFMAVSYEKIGKYNEAIAYYRESIRYNYNSNSAREMIVKLQLKIKRGY